MESLRSVAPVPEFEAEVIAEIEAVSANCVAGIDFLLEELETQDPDPDERCGLLAFRHEVYALRVPRCPQQRLVVSLDRAVAPPAPCRVHGLAPSTARPCEHGRRRAAAHLSLINPGWEPAP